jgi:hypothetical protein
MEAPTSYTEGNLKYGDRDITSGSLVFCRPKEGGACGGPLPEQIYKINIYSNLDRKIE